MPVCPATPARATRACACARQCCRRPRCYPSDATDAEWALIAPLLPVPACQTPAGGRPEEHDRRVVVDAIRYAIHNGCVWRALPADFPPWRTVYGLYQRWHARGVTIALHDALRAAARQAAGRNAEPTAAVIDAAGPLDLSRVGRHTAASDIAPASSASTVRRWLANDA